MRFVLALGFLIGAVSLVVAEEFRLVHAIDDDETTLRRGLTEDECQRLKADFLKSETIVVQMSEEDLSSGALACLPESDS